MLTAMTSTKNPFPGMNPWLQRKWSDVHTKLITFIPDNATRGLSAIQGDIVVFDDLPAHRHERVRIAIHRFGAYVKHLSPDSPDWGSTIDDGRKLLNLFPHPALAPALALMSLVLGLNLLADGLREESLKD